MSIPPNLIRIEILKSQHKAKAVVEDFIYPLTRLTAWVP